MTANRENSTNNLTKKKKNNNENIVECALHITLTLRTPLTRLHAIKQSISSAIDAFTRLSPLSSRFFVEQARSTTKTLDIQSMMP